MSKNDRRDAADPIPASADPLAVIIDDLAGDDDARRRAAREQFSSIAGAGRPWEQLPSAFKHAARDDARRVVEAASGARNDALRAAGYDSRTADQLLRDIGLAA